MDFPRFDPRAFAVLDFETTGLNYWAPDFEVLGVSVAAPELAPAFFDFRIVPNAVQWLRDMVPTLEVGGWNTKYEAHVFRNLGVADPLKYHDGMIAEALIYEHHLQYGLDAVMRRRLGRGKVDVGSKTQLKDLPPEKLAEYANGDTLGTLECLQQQFIELRQQGLERVYDLEMELLPILAGMEHTGVRVDIEGAYAAIPVLTQKIDEVQAEINRDVGRPFNVNSTPQVRAIFKPEKVGKWQYKLVDGTLCGLTKSGGPSIDQNVLKEMQHPLALKIRRLRKLIKTRDTFIRGHVLGHADANGYVHTTFNQTKSDADNGTGTGRLSSTDPALQQINARDPDTAEIIRSLFLPDEGDQWVCCDYSQVDFRFCVHLIRDERLYRAYRENPKTDFHQVVSDMTGIPRNPPYAGAPNTKQINLSLAFGAGAGKTAKTMGMPYTVEEWDNRMILRPGPEAARIFDDYHGRFPNIRKFMKSAQDAGRARGYVKTLMGRRLRFPGGKGAHKAAGLLYQANAADAHKLGLIKTHRALQAHGSGRMMISVHDEVNVSGDERVAEVVAPAYVDLAEMELRVPITCSVGIGANWRRASAKD